MRVKQLFAVVTAILFSSFAWADLEPFEDYDMSDAVWSVTTIKVHSNMGDAYLEGLKNTWVTGNKTAKELGQIEDWHIYRSQLPESGDFNLLLVIKFANTEDLAPNKARYDAFMKKFTKKMADETTEYAQKNYPAMRDIVGEYWMREITLK